MTLEPEEQLEKDIVDVELALDFLQSTIEKLNKQSEKNQKAIAVITKQLKIVKEDLNKKLRG